MIITKIRLQEEHPMTGTSISWPLPFCDLNLDSSAGENGYILKDALGLGPPNFIAVVEGYDIYGTPIMGSVPDKRDIILKIALNPLMGQSYSFLRDNLYKFINRKVFVKLMNDSIVVAQTTGYIQKFEAVHFSDKPEIQLTIECEAGELSSPHNTNIPLSTLDTDHPIINYEDGTAPTGLNLQFTYTATENGTGFTILNHSKFWYSGVSDVYTMFDLTFEFLTNDVITIATHPGEKRITLFRDPDTFDIAGYINAGAVWPKLYTGVNTFEWTFDASWMEWNSASYVPRFWGV